MNTLTDRIEDLLETLNGEWMTATFIQEELSRRFNRDYNRDSIERVLRRLDRLEIRLRATVHFTVEQMTIVHEYRIPTRTYLEAE